MADGIDREARYRAPALDKGLDILEYLSRQPGGQTRGEIVRAIGRSPGEIYRMLERLVARDYVSRSVEGDRYMLTMKLFALASAHPPLRRLVVHAQPFLDAFALETGQSVHLAVPERGAAITVAQAAGPGNWEFRIRTGARLDLAQTASGKTLLAFQLPGERLDLLADRPAAERERIIEALADEFETIRTRGYRLADSRQLVGIRDISVPVLGPDGSALAVVTCPYLHRLDVETALEADVLSALREVARRISIAPIGGP